MPIRTWFRLPFLAVCLAALASTLVLSGSDIGIVATMRELDAVAQIGIVLALWGLGSLVGGLLYGAMARSISPFWLLGGLALATLPMALAGSVWGLAAFGFLAGLLCAPTITATIDQASRIVPAAVRGEAMGWHGSFLTTGGALGAPIAGLAIDRGGPPAGFVTVAVVGLLVAVAGVATQRARRTARGAPSAVAAVTDGLDVVAVGVAHEAAEVALVVLRPQPGLVQRLGAELERGGVPAAHGVGAVGGEADVDLAVGAGCRVAAGDPEVGLSVP